MLFVGLSSVVVQVLIPFAAHLAPDAAQGRVVGKVTSGLMIGIMLSRPVASLVTHETSWPVIFMLSAVAMAVLAVALVRFLPHHQPPPGLGYPELLRSMVRLVLTTPVLRRRAAYQFCLYSAFSLFWTTVPLLLAGPSFRMSQAGIAWFGLAAVAGAIAAPLGGTLADRGYSRLATGLGIAAVVVSLPLSLLAGGSEVSALIVLVLAAIILDFGVSTNLVTSQRAIFSLGAHHRSRLNGCFMAMFFIGGALGSAVGAWAYARGGWPLSSGIGLILPLVALMLFATEFRRR
jgi:predicted MFS family arabinose efflux permease